MAFSDKDITVKFTVDSSGAVSGVEGVGSALDGLGGKAIAANQALELVEKGFSFLKGAASLAIEALDQGAKINDVSEAFGRLSERAGTTADVFIEKLNAATLQTVDNFTLMKSANDALKANLTPEQFETVARAAKLFADETGGDTVQQMDALTRALATGKEGFLKLQGVTIDAARAAEEFRQKYNLSGELTEQQQLLANQQAAISALNQKLDEAGTKAAGAGDNLEQLNKILEDARNSFLAAFESSDVVRQSLVELKNAIKQIDFTALTAGLIGFINAVIKGIGYLKEFVLTLKDIATFNFSGGLQRQWESALKSQAESIAKQTSEIEKQKESLDSLGNTGVNVFNLLEIPVQSLAKDLRMSVDTTAKLGTALKSIPTKPKKKWAPSDLLVDNFDRELDKEFEAAFRNIKVKLPVAFKISTQGGGAGSSATEAGKQYGEDFTDGTETSLLDQAWDITGGAIGQALVQGLEGDAKGALKGLGSNLGQMAGEHFGGPFGGAVGAFLGEKIGKGIFDGIIHVFGGGKNKDTRMRKALDKWLSEQLKGTGFSAIVDGQLKKIEDFNFGGSKAFNKPNWAEYFQGLPAAAQDAFGGAAAVLAEKLNLDPALIGQFASVLSTNLGGSINNLQVLMETLNITAEEAGKMIVQSFKEGALSAADAARYIDGVNQTMQKGIPDAVGAYDLAWKNMVAAGSKGGMMLIDSIRDIGEEMKQAGVKDIEGLKLKFQEMVKQGILSQEQYDNFFKALAENGIESLDKLANASDETAIRIAASLEKNNVIKDMSSVGEQINKLPDKKVVKIEVQTYFTGDPKAAAALDLKQPVGSAPGVGA